VQIQHTVAQLAHLAHWNYAVVSYDPANPATFNSAVNTALTKHANYIVEAGIPVAPAILQQVEHAGAKLAVTAVYPIAVKPPVIVNTSADNSTQGNLMADYFVSDSNGKGNAVVAHVPGYAILDGFTNAFTARVKALCPGCTTATTNVTLPQLAAGQLVPTVISALKRNPSASYVVFDDGPFATGITSALAAAGLSKVKVIGEAGDSAALAALRNGTEAAWTGYSSPYATLQVVDAMFRDAEGLPIPQAQEGIQPTQLLTKANVGSITEWNYPTDALQQFKALWNVSRQ
jgi:ribose transport system substrate-binding protein